MDLLLNSFINAHRDDDVNRLALQRNRYSDMTDADFDFALQQIEGRQRSKQKLPFAQSIDDWWYPKHLSLEQCSSEQTARYKQQLLRSAGETQSGVFTDLTGGYGIDTLFLSRLFRESHYVEQQEELCRIAEHNFHLEGASILVHHASAEEYIRQLVFSDLIYIDPARRDHSGGKVYQLSDCTPNVLPFLAQLQTKCRQLLLKLSPMLDLSVVMQQLPAAEVHIVAVRGEVKELLLLCRFDGSSNESASEVQSGVSAKHDPRCYAVNLESAHPAFVFTRQQEQSAQCVMAERMAEYLYEPNAAILKAGAFKTIAERYDLMKLEQNTHLYTSDKLVEAFPGRVFHILAEASKKRLKGEALSVLVRNYPLSANQLRSQYRLQESDNRFLIAARCCGKPVLFLAERVG